MSQLIVIVGITGNQGGSVARRFLSDKTYTIRALTRTPTSATATTLSAQGIEIVRADLNDPLSLTRAFQGANLIFTVTNYWEAFFDPGCRAIAEGRGVSIRGYAAEVEARQGRNMADAAAATVGSLNANGFIVSTLSHAGRCTGGEMTDVYHFDGKAEVFPYYVEERYPELARKMSCVQTGYFTSSYKLIPWAWLVKKGDGAFVTSFPQTAGSESPHLFVTHDMGPFVYAVSQLPPGKTYMAAGTVCSWAEWMRTWGEVTGREARYEQLSREEFLALDAPDAAFALEVAVMFEYSSQPGYDGGMVLLGPEDIRKLGVDCPMVSLREWMQQEDWSAVLA